MKELSDILSGAGIDEGIADDLLAECQRRRGADIGFEDLDPEALEMIAGGEGIDKGSCDNDFYKEACSSTVESGSWCSANDWCILFSSTYSAKEDYDRNKCRISYYSPY